MFGRTPLAAALATASVAYAQITLPSSVLGYSISPACGNALLSVFSSGDLASCFPLVPDLLPAFQDNSSSIIPGLDMFMSSICYTQPCSNATLNAAAMTVLSGCQGDIMNASLSNASVTDGFNFYPIVREVLCTKTANPYTNTSYGGLLGSAPIPITGDRYNSTGGTFCVTSVLTQLSAYFSVNLTVPFISNFSKNTTAVDQLHILQSNVLCNDCLFGALDIVEQAVPAIGMMDAGGVATYFNMSTTRNTTLNAYVNSTCAYVPLVANASGMLPTNISVSIINSTDPYKVTDGNGMSA